MQPPHLKKIGSTSLCFYLFCFFLPFLTISCPGEQKRFSGMQLAFGTSVAEPALFGEPKRREIPGDPLILLALALAIPGLLVAYNGKERQQFVVTGVAVVSLGLLLIAKTKISAEVLREGDGILQTNFGEGYWLALLSLVATGIVSHQRVQLSKSATHGDEPDPPPEPTPDVAYESNSS